MGVDVYGNAPTTEQGEYFRNNVWAWRPLADYIIDTSPQIAAGCCSWFTNDGEGLNAKDSTALADALQAEIDAGHTESYAKIRDAEIAAMPNMPCRICGGTGRRLPSPDVGPGELPCNGCDETGSVRPWDSHYPFWVENVQGFVTFLRGCGGFKIW